MRASSERSASCTLAAPAVAEAPPQTSSTTLQPSTAAKARTSSVVKGVPSSTMRTGRDGWNLREVVIGAAMASVLAYVRVTSGAAFIAS